MENIPKDINVEVLLNHYSGKKIHVEFKGLHKRNSYKDILNIEKLHDKILLSLGRNSLYNSLPEYIFHAIDRFDNIPQQDKEKRFAEEYAKQEKEKENAYKFFVPIDILLLQFRLEIRRILDKYIVENQILQNILSDNLTYDELNNRFIKRTLPYLASCKRLRGDKTLLTLLLRKVFLDEGIYINIKRECMLFTDELPRYDNRENSELGKSYLSNEYFDSPIVFNVLYWSDEECNKDFPAFVKELDVYRCFVQDYFLSVNSVLKFDVQKDAPTLRLSDTTIYNYLNYNTNI